MVKNLPADVGDMCLIPGSGRSPGGGNGDPLQWYSSILAWKIPWTEEPGGLQSMKPKSQQIYREHRFITARVFKEEIMGSECLQVQSFFWRVTKRFCEYF